MKKKKLNASSVVFVQMPVNPACTRKQGESVEVACYKVAKPPRSKWRPVYIRIDALDLFLAYAADQFVNKGIAEPEIYEKKRKGNCAAVAELHLEYDIQAKAWLAEFVAGEHIDVERKFALASFSKQDWDKMIQEGLADVSGDYAHATVGDKKKMGKAFITQWCVAILREEEEVFIQQWPLVGNLELVTPIRKRWRSEW